VGGVEHFAEGAAKAVDLPDHQLILGAQEVEGSLEGRALGAGAPALLLLEDLGAASGLQGIALQVQVLVLGGDARVADQHVTIVA
jgi:hypothetical protein